jgi:hypothetical protein
MRSWMGCAPGGVRSVALCCVLVVSIGATAGAGVRIADASGATPGSFTSLQAAVNAAVSGDVVLVKDGTYDQVLVDGKSLSIVADAGASVVLGASPISGLPALTIQGSLGPTRVTVQGIAVSSSAPGSGTDVGLRVGGGAVVWLESVAVDGFNTGFDLNGAEVIAHACEFYGAPGDPTTQVDGGIAVVAQNATLSFHGVTAVGGQGLAASTLANPAGIGGIGVLLDGGTLFCSGSLLGGGAGGDGIDFGGPCVAGGDGGVALVLAAHDPHVVVVDTSVDGGVGGAKAGACGAGNDGASTDESSGSFSVETGTARSFHAQSPVRAGQSVTLKFSGEPGDARILFFAGSFQTLRAPSFSGALHLGLPMGDLALPPMPGNGDAFSVVLPALPPGLEGVTIHLQPAYVDLAGVAYLHAASALVVLDAGL